MLETTLKNRLSRYQQWLYRHTPGLARWLDQRLTTRRFSGLPLTALIGLLIGNGLLLWEVAESLVQAEPMVQVYRWFTQWVFAGRTSSLSQLFYAITWLGSGYVTVGLSLLGSVVLLMRGQRRNVLILWGLLAGVSGLVQVDKRTFVRARPLAVAYYPETGFSFPSGHSATAMTLYDLLAYWWIRRLSRTRDRVGVGVLASVLIGLVGYSRIYLSVHFLSDVVGGYLLGSGWLLLGIILTEWVARQPARPVQRPAA